MNITLLHFSALLTLTNLLLFPSTSWFMPFPSSVDNVRSFFSEYIVERDRAPGQEIALVSTKSNAPGKIEVALIKKGETKVKPWALLEGSLSSRSLCTCHPDSIPAFFSRKRTADKNTLWRDIAGNATSRYTDVKQNLHPHERTFDHVRACFALALLGART